MATVALPPWLSPEAAQGWGELAAKGAQLKLERARLRQEGINAGMEAAARSQQQQQTAAREQQQIQYDQAYKTADLGLRQQEADQRAQQLQQEVAQTARQFSAMQRISKRIAAGEDPTKVYMEEGPSAGATPDAMMKTLVKKPAFVPSSVTVDGQQLISTSPNHFTRLVQPKPTKPTLDADAPPKVIRDANGNPVSYAFKMSDGTYGNPRALTDSERDDILASDKESKTGKSADSENKEPSERDINYLKANPHLKDQFDKEFGAGAADAYIAPVPAIAPAANGQ